jgi:hypothetical protein
VEGVTNTTPPPGPTIPISHAPPDAQIPALVVKLADVTEVNDVDAKVKVYVPAVVCVRSVNVATPLTAVTVVVPPKVPPEAETVTDTFECETVLPTASTMRTTG